MSSLVKIISDVIKTKNFDEGTRSQAAEIILTLAEHIPAILRKTQEIKTEFFPTLV